MVQERTNERYYIIFKYFWIIVLFPKPLQLIILGMLLLYVSEFKPQLSKDNFGKIQIGVLALYLVSIIINIIMYEHTLERIFASVNTWGISLIALSLYAVYQKVDLDLKQIGKYSFINLLVMSFFLILYLFLPNMERIHIGGYQLFAEDILFEEYCTRFVGMFAYANLITVFVLCALPFVLFFLKGNKIGFAICIGVCYLFTDYANSRTGKLLLLALFLSWLYVNLWLIVPTKYRKYFLLGTVVLGILAIVICSPYLTTIIDKLMSSRAGSNASRTTIYRESMQRMLHNNFILGLGVKDIIEGTPYPYGSHSSYLGYFYKTGIIGGMLYAFSFLLQALKVVKWKKQNQFDYILFIGFFGVLIWMILEDLDGVNWSICIFYIYMAILNQKMKQEGNMSDESTIVYNR